MQTKAFIRELSRSFAVAPDFPIIVALCGSGEFLKHTFKAERDAGKIVLTLTEGEGFADLNTSTIALADELFILNLAGNYNDFEAAMYITAERLGKHIRVLKP